MTREEAIEKLRTAEEMMWGNDVEQADAAECIEEVRKWLEAQP